MKTLHLHIGRHKSGTSSLQHIFSSKTDFLNKNNFYYPLAGRGSIVAHHGLATAFNQRIFSTNKDAEKFVEGIRIELESCQQENILISSEAFQNITRLNNLKSFFNLFDKTIIYIYFREPLDYLQSAYRQKVQNSNYHKSFEEYAQETKFDYPRFLKNWKTVSDEVIVRFFNRDLLINNDVVDDFFSLLNIDTSQVPKDLNLNPSIGGNLLFYKLLLNKNELHSDRLYNGLMEIAGTEKRYRESFFISKELSEFIRNNHKADLEFLTNQFGNFKLIDFSLSETIPDLNNLIQDFEKFRTNKKVFTSLHKIYS